MGFEARQPVKKADPYVFFSPDAISIPCPSSSLAVIKE